VLAAAGVAHALHPYRVSGTAGYGKEAAAALGVDEAQMGKTLVARVDELLVLAVVPVSSSLDLKALAAAVGGRRASMAEPAAATRATGYVTGGISPLGTRSALPVVVDAALAALPVVFVSAGRRGLQVSLAAADLVALTGAATAAIARSR
jgi:Cys-tRNA(Pro)/Cys-tRNA(Cys) deacylase